MQKKLALSFLCFSVILKAQNENLINNNFEEFLQKRQETEINKLLNKELEKEEKLQKDEGILTHDEKTKFLIKKITLLGEEIPEIKKIKVLLKKYTNQNLGIKEIQELAKKMTNIYIQQGYVGARVLIPTDQNLRDGELKFQIVLGKIESIDFNDNTDFYKFKTWWTFPTEKNSILKISDIEHGIAIINKVPQNKATMNIYPGDTFGGSIVKIKNERKSYLHGLYLNFSNSGNDDTGKNKITLNYSFGDLIGINEIFSIYGATNIFDNYQDKKDNNFGAEITIPFKTWDTGISYNQSSTLNTLQGNLRELKFKGENRLISYRVGKVLLTYPQGKLRLDSSLNLKTKKNFVNGEKIEVSSRNSTNWKNTLSLTGKAYNSVYYSSLSYQKGIHSFGASEDLGKEKDSPNSDYEKYNVYLKIIKPFLVQNSNFTYEISGSAQYTRDNLYSDEKYSLGNEITVRGYRDGISGNNGYFLRNQIYYSFPGEWQNIRIYSGIDTGEVGDKESKKQHLLGNTFGIDYATQYFSMDLSVGIPLKKISNNNDNHLIYFSINTYF